MVLINEKAIVPAAITTQVATVRHRISVPVNCQIARREATTATRIQALVVQKETLLTNAGLRNPRFFCRRSDLSN